MLEELKREDFVPHVGGRFELEHDSGAMELVLEDACELEVVSSERRAPFSLLFRGPEQPALEQQTYRLSQSELGDLDIFLVPVGQNGSGILYEAVFT